VQVLCNKISLLSEDRGAVVKAAKKRLEKAKAALVRAKDLHADNAEQVNLKKAEQECAAEERKNLSEQLDAVKVDLTVAQVGLLH